MRLPESSGLRFDARQGMALLLPLPPRFTQFEPDMAVTLGGCWNSDCVVRFDSHCSGHRVGPFLTHIRGRTGKHCKLATPISLPRRHFWHQCGYLPGSDRFFPAVAFLRPGVSQMLRTNVQNNTARDEPRTTAAVRKRMRTRTALLAPDDRKQRSTGFAVAIGSLQVTLHFNNGGVPLDLSPMAAKGSTARSAHRGPLRAECGDPFAGPTRSSAEPRTVPFPRFLKTIS